MGATYERWVHLWGSILGIGIVLSCAPFVVSGCRAPGESQMKEMVIFTRTEGSAVIEFVAFVDPRTLQNAGVTEHAFRDEVRILFAAEAFAHIFHELLDPKSEESEAGTPKSSLHEIQDEAIRSLLDKGVRAETRRTEGGRTKVVQRLTIFTTGIVEDQEQNDTR